jgi:hypothetical protein
VAVLIALSCFHGCREASGGKEDKSAQADPPSANYLIESNDYQAFRAGRSMDDILKEIQWRGNFQEAGEHKGNRIYAISYGLLGGPFKSGGGTVVWAIFVNEKFEKIVDWPDWDGKPIEIGDHRRLIKATESEAINIPELIKERQAAAEPPSKSDPGLTVVWLLFGRATESAWKKEYSKNAKVRDQYNACRLRIGMTETDVDSVLRSKPVHTGQLKDGVFKIYGSNESFGQLNSDVHYSNVLVIFHENKVTGVYRLGGGEKGLQVPPTIPISY